MEVAIVDERDDLYQKIVDEYHATGSVKQVVANLNTNTIKVRRVLITEGLWESPTSRNVAECYAAGMSVKEIANELCMSEKNVQSYMPYTRGAYGGTKSNDAERSGEYRDRMKQAAVSQASVTEGSNADYHDNVIADADNSNIFDFASARKDFSEETFIPHRPPAVLKLRFELISSFFEDEPDKGLRMNDKEKEDFLKYAKAKEGIIREVLVPGEMTLHCMHYMLQKLFGWQNSHLHKYFLSSSDFEMVTDNKKVDDYMNLCGTLFRFPDSELDDQFWDDDYEEGISIKSWLRSKYNYGFLALAVEDSYPRNREYVKDFKAEYRKELKKNRNMTLTELRDIAFFESSYNVLIESLSLRDLFAKSYRAAKKLSGIQWRAMQKEFVQHKVDYYDEFEKDDPEEYDAMLGLLEELLELRKSEVSFQRGIHTGDYDEIKKQFGKKPEKIIEELNERIRMLERVLIPDIADGNPQPVPFADSIYYCYDFGDDWTVRITCTEAYFGDQDFDWCNPDATDRTTGKRKTPKEPIRYTDSSGYDVPEEETERISQVYLGAKPVCVYADGLNVMDDVGGIHGFADFLETINGDDYQEVSESKEWAKWMGWTGRKTKPENIL